MISDSWAWNLTGGLLLALIATAALVEVKSSSLVPKSLLLWPLFVLVYGLLNLIQGGFLFPSLLGKVLGVILILCGLQALFVNLRRLSPWPSGAIWLGLGFVGIGLQVYPFFLHRVAGFLWLAIGVTKVIRERSASLEAGTPFWILLLYAQAVLLASYR